MDKLTFFLNKLYGYSTCALGIIHAVLVFFLIIELVLAFIKYGDTAVIGGLSIFLYVIPILIALSYRIFLGSRLLAFKKELSKLFFLWCLLFICEVFVFNWLVFTNCTLTVKFGKVISDIFLIYYGLGVLFFFVLYALKRSGLCF